MPDLLGGFLLALVLLAPLPLCVVFASAHLDPRRTARSHYALVVAAAWVSVQLCLALALGMLSRLTLLHAVVAEGALLVAGVGAVVRGRHRLAPLARAWQPPVGSERLLAIGLAAVGARLIYSVLATPVRDGDSLFYHLPAVANWYRTGDLGMLGWGDLDHYPYHWELLALLFVLPFGNDFAIGLVQLLAWLLLGLAVYCTATLLGARPFHSLLAAFLVMLQPLVLRHVGSTLQVDLAFAAAFMTTVYFVLAHAARDLHWSLIAVAAAWLAGVKTSGVPYLVLTLLILALARMTAAWPEASRRWLDPRRPAPAVILLSLALASMNAGFWYVRNLVTVGNPLGLVAVKGLGVTIFDGPIAPADLRRSTLAAVFDPLAGRDWTIFLTQLAANLGAPFIVLVAGAILLPVAMQGGRPDRRWPAILVAVLLAATVTLYLVTPYTGDNGSHGWQVTPWVGQALRFAFPATAILAVAAALGMAGLVRWDLAVTGVAMAAGFVSLRGGAAEVLLLVGGVWVWVHHRHRLPRAARHLAYGLAVVLLVIGGLWCRPLKEARRARMFPVGHYLDQQVPAGERIGLLATSRAYVFFGSALQFDVVLVPHGTLEESQWVRWLQSNGIRFLGVGPIPEEWWLTSRELAWLERSGGRFERLYGRDYRHEPVLYRLRPAVPG